MPESEKKSYDTIESGPTITPEMIKMVHQTLDTRGLLYHSEGKVYIPTEKGWRLFSEIKPVKEELHAYGSTEITATSDKCVCFTKLEKMGQLKEKDCIVCVKAGKSCRDLGDSLKDSLKAGSRLKITIEAGGVEDSLEAFGSPALLMTDPEAIAIRKDDQIDERTVAIMADKSAGELKRELLDKLKNHGTKINILLESRP